MALSGYRDPNNKSVNYSDLFGQVIFVYKNWKGIIEERRVTPISIEFRQNDFHDEAQWFLVGHCHARNEIRDFAFEDIIGNIRHVRRRNNDAKRQVLAGTAKRNAQERAATNTVTLLLETEDVGSVEPDLTKSVRQVTIEHKK